MVSGKRRDVTRTGYGAAEAAEDGGMAAASQPADPTREAGYREFQRARRAHWDAAKREQWGTRGWGGYYHRRLAEISGPTRVVGGDTLEVAGERIRRYGVDAPEAEQTCREWAQRADYACGEHATAFL